jgi:uncharacterized membrane protein
MAGKPGRIIRRGALLFGLVAASAALMAFEFVSGVILWVVLPSGQGSRLSGSAAVWGLDRHAWIDLHNWAALMLTAVVIVHVALHWKWVVRQTRAYITGRRPLGVTRKASGESA